MSNSLSLSSRDFDASRSPSFPIVTPGQIIVSPMFIERCVASISKRCDHPHRLLIFEITREYVSIFFVPATRKPIARDQQNLIHTRSIYVSLGCLDSRQSMPVYLAHRKSAIDKHSARQRTKKKDKHRFLGIELSDAYTRLLSRCSLVLYAAARLWMHETITG